MAENKPKKEFRSGETGRFNPKIEPTPPGPKPDKK